MMFSLLFVYALGHPEVMSFKEWHGIFGPDANAYSRKKTMENREIAFNANVQKIEEHNAKNLSWRMGVNHLSDLTAAEFSELMGFGSCRKIMNLTQRTENRNDKKIFQVRNPKNLDTVDYRSTNNPLKKIAVTGVKNQGGCGSCWSFSASGAVEGAWVVAGNELVSLSEQELVSCDKYDSACNGGFMDYALQWVKENGLTSEANYPYVSGNGAVPRCNTEKVQQKVATIKSYKDVEHASEDALENALNIGPVAIGIEADQYAFQSYRTGVMTGTCGSSIDHGVLAAGYGHDSKSNLDYWIVKNSWGSSWGMDGYILLERHIRSRAGQCGILMQPSYPIATGVVPTPKPTPKPTPTPGPSPGPSPSTDDYEDPDENDGSCHTEEVKVVDPYGVGGRMCMPKCNSTSDCPAGPKGWPSPTCILPYGYSMVCGVDCQKNKTICPTETECISILGSIYICLYND
jgi:C1A family cysteine protease